jgi:aryl-alcohol dehydrogenase-like predicted oxidoreductase
MSSDMMKQFLPEQQRADRVVAAVQKVSDQVGRSMAQVALAWLRYRAVPVIPILGPQAHSIAGQSRQHRLGPFARAGQDSR